VVHAHPSGDPTGPVQRRQTSTSRVVANHAYVVRHRHEQRAGIEITGLSPRVDLERWLARVAQVDGVAVVHHTLEHRQRHDPHQNDYVRVALVPDLMDRSKLNGVADLVVVATADALDRIEGLGPGDVVAVDLSRAGALEAATRAAASGARVFGFASHVDGETMRAANAAGITAMARSAFFGRVTEVYQERSD